MHNAILVHGTPGKEEYFDPSFPPPSQSHWFAWLQRQLQVNDVFTVSVDMPDPWQPRYQKWKKEFERFDVSSETTLVGHSCGGGFLVRWLSENPVAVGKVILVAPWLDPNRTGDTTDFFDFEIDRALASRCEHLMIYSSTNDADDIQASIAKISEHIDGAQTTEFESYGHFCLGDLGTEEFPELLAECLGTRN